MSAPNDSRSSQEKKTEFIQIRISPRKKKEIESFIEEKGFKSLTSFVIFAVDFYINFGEKIERILQLLEQANSQKTSQKPAKKEK